MTRLVIALIFFFNKKKKEISPKLSVFELGNLMNYVEIDTPTIICIIIIKQTVFGLKN